MVSFLVSSWLLDVNDGILSILSVDIIQVVTLIAQLRQLTWLINSLGLLMNSKADVIAVSTDRPVYPQEKSRYFGSVKKEKLRLVFAFYSPDGNEIAMPIASMSCLLYTSPSPRDPE